MQSLCHLQLSLTVVWTLKLQLYQHRKEIFKEFLFRFYLCACVGMCTWVQFPGPEYSLSCDVPHVDAENQAQVLCKEQYRLGTAQPAPAMKT